MRGRLVVEGIHAWSARTTKHWLKPTPLKFLGRRRQLDRDKRKLLKVGYVNRVADPLYRPAGPSDARRQVGAGRSMSYPATPTSSEAKYAKTSSARRSETSCSAVLHANAGKSSVRNQDEAASLSPLRAVAASITRSASRDPFSVDTLAGTIREIEGWGAALGNAEGRLRQGAATFSRVAAQAKRAHPLRAGG